MRAIDVQDQENATACDELHGWHDEPCREYPRRIARKTGSYGGFVQPGIARKTGSYGGFVQLGIARMAGSYGWLRSAGDRP